MGIFEGLCLEKDSDPIDLYSGIATVYTLFFFFFTDKRYLLLLCGGLGCSLRPHLFRLEKSQESFAGGKNFCQAEVHMI